MKTKLICFYLFLRFQYLKIDLTSTKCNFLISREMLEKRLNSLTDLVEILELISIRFINHVGEMFYWPSSFYNLFLFCKYKSPIKYYYFWNTVQCCIAQTRGMLKIIQYGTWFGRDGQELFILLNFKVTINYYTRRTISNVSRFTFYQFTFDLKQIENNFGCENGYS